MDLADRIHTFGTDAHLILRVVLEETFDTTAGELDGRITVSHSSINGLKLDRVR